MIGQWKRKAGLEVLEKERSQKREDKKEGQRDRNMEEEDLKMEQNHVA